MLLNCLDGVPVWAEMCYELGKQAADDNAPEVSYNLAGTLQLSASGWLILSVPNSLVYGIFNAMHEPGIELPPGKDGHFNAHISVMRPDEIKLIGGGDKIKERGRQFKYTLGRLYSLDPDNWQDYAKIWYVRVVSPELQELRRSYGLSSLPNEGKYAFHATVAVRRKNVLGRNTASRVAEISKV